MRKTAVAAITLLISTMICAQGAVVYKNSGSALYDAIGETILREARVQGIAVPEGPLDVAANPDQARADLEGLANRNIRYVYAVGGGAVALATAVQRFGGVYVYIPNPYAKGLAHKSRWLGVSPYPAPASVLRYLRDTAGLKRFAVVYTLNSNKEIAQEFEKAAGGEGVSCTLVGLEDSGGLADRLGGVISGVDGVILLLDPITFNSNSLRFIVTTCMENKKPTISFKDDTAGAGVTMALYPTPEDIGKKAVEAMRTLQEKGEDRTVFYSDNLVVAVNDAALGTLGLKFDQSKVVKHY